jgi:hypothetical protein
MSRTTALVLVFLAALLMSVAVMLSLAAVGVRGEVLAVATLAPGALSAFAVAEIVMRYDEPDRRRR